MQCQLCWDMLIWNLQRIRQMGITCLSDLQGMMLEEATFIHIHPEWQAPGCGDGFVSNHSSPILTSRWWWPWWALNLVQIFITTFWDSVGQWYDYLVLLLNFRSLWDMGSESYSHNKQIMELEKKERRSTKLIKSCRIHFGCLNHVLLILSTNTTRKTSTKCTLLT